MIDLDPETRRTLREQQVAHVKARLRGDAGRAALATNLEAGWRAVLSSKVADVVDPRAVAAAVEGVLSDPLLSDAIRPAARAAVLIELARLREDDAKLGAYVPAETRAALRELAERPGLLPERFVREALTHRAFEEVMRDVLDGALEEFQKKANPLTAEWGLPSILKKAGPFGFGLGAFAASFEAVRGEIEKKLDPQRKIFLQSFARRALATMADFVIKRHDEPQFVALRKEMLDWLLDQPVRELVATIDQGAGELAEGAASAAWAHVTQMDDTRRRRRAAIEMAVAAHGRQTVREAMAAYGVDPTGPEGRGIDWNAIAAAVWPAVERGLASPAAEAWVEDLVGSFWDELAPRDGP
jgi:hypothetical protein